jgi:hypothetical protein
MAGRDRLGQVLESLAGDTSRRGFLARVGGGLVAATAGGVVAKVVKPGDANAYTNFCGHTFTTGSCIHPLGLPRVDSRGYPVNPDDGKPVDDIGRRVNSSGQPINDHGGPKRDADGLPLPPAPRTKICKETARIYDIHADPQGSWYRCCAGTVRKLWDCCAHHDQRINGDAALTGYCYRGRKVFCVTYYQTHVPC